MSFFDKIFPKEPQEDYFKRNSGKKVMATILEPTEQELKSAQNEHPTDTK